MTVAPKVSVLRSLFLLPTLLVSAFGLPAQNVPKQNLNTYYRFPLSVGAEYESLSPFGPYRAMFNSYEISGHLRWPIPSLPVIQPMLKGGIMRFDSTDLAEPSKWSHTNWFGAAGLAASYRFAKTFEIGVEALGGYAESSFQNLLPDIGTVGYGNLYLEAGARISLDPAFNFSVDIHPNMKYLKSLGPLSDYDGLMLGVGFSAHYRFGQDPDAPQTVIRALRFSGAKIPPAYAAMQSYYAKNPIGKVTITNTEKDKITDLEVSFFQAGYMDSPTPVATFPELDSQQSVEIPLLASFNDAVFITEGITPLTGEIIATYKAKGRPVEQRQSVSYDLHDKTAVTWDDDRKVGAFITPSDSALRNYASFIRQSCKDITIPAFNEALQYGMQLYGALGEIGCLYQADPSMPFTKAQGDPLSVDSISLPRDTLKRITGDCDDLTVLYCSLLETAGMETGFITLPGHIYAVFNTKVPTNKYQLLHPERKMTINLDGELWIPVEITMIGKTDFLSAWRKGVEEWTAYDDAPDKRVLTITQKAQETYRPVGLKETDLGLQYGSKEAVRRAFSQDMDRLAEFMVGDLASAARKSGRKEDFNRLGVTYARLLRYDAAEQSFRKALEIDPGYLSPQINLGNILLLRKQYAQALERFNRTIGVLQERGEDGSLFAAKVLLNMSQANYMLDRFDTAADLLTRAAKLAPSEAERFQYLGVSPKGSARASELAEPGANLIYVEGDE